MSKKSGGPLALNDFYKSNGGEYVVYNDGPSLTRQEFAEECDVNSIMARYERTGALPANHIGEPFYADFTQIPDDLMQSLRMFSEAEKAFMMLPASVRREFDNDPHAFVGFATDPNNLGQMREWGLAPPAAAPGAPPAGAASASAASAESPSPASPAPPAGGSG